jgi:hypothetical protein
VFVNPNDENFVDADELLLALTEEWGDASQAAARREAVNRQKAEKMAGAQDAQRKELLAQLSLLRGSLKSFDGDKGSPRYQNRVKKINIVEKALLNNPGITEQQKTIARKDTPFLYSQDLDQVVLKGDLFFSYGTPYEIVALNFKKQEFTGKPLREERHNSYSPYSQKQNLNEEMSIVKMKSANNFAYYPQPSREDKKRILSIDTKDFYRIEDDSFKEKYYERHLKTCRSNPDFTPVYFFIYQDNGKLLIQDHAPYTADDHSIQAINPFNEVDREKLKTALRAGIEFENKYRQESQLETIGETMPEIGKLIEKAMAGPGQEVAEGSALLKENTPENFRENLIEMGRRPRYRNDVMAAAQRLIRTAEPSDRERLKEKLLSLGCTSPDSTRNILAAWIQERPGIPQRMTPPDPGLGR